MRTRTKSPTHSTVNFMVASPYPNVDRLHIEITKWMTSGKNVYHFDHDSLLYIYSGSCRFELGDGRAYDGVAGDVLILRGGTEWRYLRQGGDSMTMMSVNFKGALTDEMLVTYGLSNGVHAKNTHFQPLVSDFETVCARPGISKDELGDELIVFLFRAFRHIANAIAPPTGVADEIRQYIQSEIFRQKLSLSALSKAFGMRTTDLQRLFKEHYGMTVHRYQIELRMQEVRRLLADTDRTVLDICNAVGYSDHCYLDRLFRKMYGMSPLEYRRSMRKGKT